MFSCQICLPFLIKYLQTVSPCCLAPCCLASWGSSLNETINFMLLSIGWLDALWRKNWYESTEMKSTIVLPSTVASCYMLLSFANWFYSFIWGNSEWILLENCTGCEAALRSLTVCGFLAIFFLHLCSHHWRSALCCLFEAHSATAVTPSHYKI